MKIACSLLAISILCFAAFQAARRARAERLFLSDQLPAVRQAVRLDPGNARYLLGLAELVEQEGGDPGPALRAAAQASPRDVDAWIRLGLRAELEQDADAAETSLQRAAQISKKFEPRWALANFYFRSGRNEEFWRWVREALQVSYGDRTPLFELCWRAAPDPALILRQAIPEERSVLREFAAFLLWREQWDAAGALLVRLSEMAAAPESDFFLDGCDKLLEQFRTRPAAEIWDSLRRRRLLADPANRGFDWRILDTPGVSVTPAPPEGWRMRFSGNQPEHCQVLSRIVPVEEGKEYRVEQRYRASRDAAALGESDTGLRWKVRAHDAGGVLLVQSAALIPDAEREEHFVFRAPAGVSGVRLVLEYDRAPGTTRLEGTVWLQWIRFGSNR